MKIINFLSSGIYTQHPPTAQFCDSDVFVSSTVINNKVFLLPGKQADRVADWYQARQYCAQHCAEIVTINSDAEFTLANNFISSNFDLTGVVYTNSYWLGAQVLNGNLSTWSNGQNATYQPKGNAGEFSVNALYCLHVYVPSQLTFWTNPCNDRIAVVCQRPTGWTPCY